MTVNIPATCSHHHNKFAPETLDPLSDDDRHHHQRRKRIGPPPAEQSVEQQPSKQNTDNAPRSEPVFWLERNRVDSKTISDGFEEACQKAEITFGQTKAGGLTWHDLRHTFATRLRGEGVHELDIMQLLGHSSLGVTTGYAHGTPTVIQNAVNKLAQTTGEVVQFAKAS